MTSTVRPSPGQPHRAVSIFRPISAPRWPLFAALAAFGSFSFAQTAHPVRPALAVSLVVAIHLM